MQTVSMTTTTNTAERVRRYVIVNQSSGRIVATFPGRHATLERICDRLDHEYRGTFIYDDAGAASEYLPQIGPNLSLRRGR